MNAIGMERIGYNRGAIDDGHHLRLIWLPAYGLQTEFSSCFHIALLRRTATKVQDQKIIRGEKKNGADGTGRATMWAGVGGRLVNLNWRSVDLLQSTV